PRRQESRPGQGARKTASADEPRDGTYSDQPPDHPFSKALGHYRPRRSPCREKVKQWRGRFQQRQSPPRNAPRPPGFGSSQELAPLERHSDADHAMGALGHASGFG